MKDPIQHRGGEYGVSHHLSPFGDLFVGRKDDRPCFVGITDEVEEAVSLLAGDRCVSDLINDYQLCLSDVLQPEAGTALRLGPVKDLHEVRHPLKADCVAAVDCLQAESGGDHCLAEPGRPGKDDVAVSIQPVQFLELADLAGRDAFLQFRRIEFIDGTDIRGKVGTSIIALSPPVIPALYFCFQEIEQELAIGKIVVFRLFQDICQLSGGVLQGEGLHQGGQL